MNMYEAIMEGIRRMGKSPEFIADTQAKMEATPGMIESLKVQTIVPGQEEKTIVCLVKEAQAMEASPTRLKAVRFLNQALLRQREIERN